MTRKNKTDDNNYHKNYYHHKGLRKIQTSRARLNYWRRKYASLIGSNKSEIDKSLSELDLKDFCETINKELGFV